MTYELKKVKVEEGATTTYITYEVVDYDGNEEKLKRTLEKLEKNAMFFERYSIDNSNRADGKVFIILDSMHLD